jgi:Tetratricopeptide repeat
MGLRLARVADAGFGHPWIFFLGVAFLAALGLTWLHSIPGEKPAAIAGIGLLAFVALVAGHRVYRIGRSLGHETLAVEHEYTFLRPDGSLVIARSRVWVRFLHDTASLAARVQGPPGSIEHFSTEGGRVVDRFEVDGRQWALISLGELRRRGAKATLETTRTLVDAFPEMRESIAFEPTGRPASVTIRILFPPERPARNVHVTLQKRWFGRRESDAPFELKHVDRREVLTFTTGRAREDSRYLIEWEWPRLEVVVSHPEHLAELAHRLMAHLGEHGLASTTAGAAGPALLRSAPGVVLIVDDEPPDEALRAQWAAALHSYRDRPALVVTVGDAPVPSELKGLRTIAAPPARGDWTRTLDLIRRELWRTPHEEPIGTIPSDAQAREAADELLRRAREARERAAPAEKKHLEDERRRLEAELALEPDDASHAALAYALGLVLRRLGYLEIARQRFEEAAEELERTYGRSDRRLAEATFNLGSITAELGDRADAERLLARAVEVGERAFGEDDAKLRLFRSALVELRSESVTR